MTELKRIAYDYNCKHYEYNYLNNRVVQNKKIEKKNDDKIKELKEWKKNLEQISQEMYGITELINVKGQMKLKEKNEKNKKKIGK